MNIVIKEVVSELTLSIHVGMVIQRQYHIILAETYRYCLLEQEVNKHKPTLQGRYICHGVYLAKDDTLITWYRCCTHRYIPPNDELDPTETVEPGKF